MSTLGSSEPEPGPAEPEDTNPEPLTLCAGVGRVDCVAWDPDPCVVWFDCVDMDECVVCAAEEDEAKEDEWPPLRL